jgi:hypothetical protein
MIRRDYILRMVQEMVQLLARVVFLKSRREYEEALREINLALRQVGASGDDDSVPTEDEWLALCRKHEATASGLTLATADLLREQGEVLALQGKSGESRRSRLAALTLFLEAILTGGTFVSEELLAKVEHLIAETADGPRPSAVWLRLVRYLEARVRYGQAEDTLFEWAKSGDGQAKTEGAAFYERRLAEDDAALEAGGLPRAEVLEGQREFGRIIGGASASAASAQTPSEPV